MRLTGELSAPSTPVGLIILACCGDTCRLSSRNRQVAGALNERGFATLLLDLLEPHEKANRPDALESELLGNRLVAASRWAMSHPDMTGLPVGYLSSSTAAAAALCAAAKLGDRIRGVVSRGGRPDLTCECLDRVRAPTLLIVGENQQVHALNERVADRLCCPHELREIPGATQLFEEPGAPDRIATLTAAWFMQRLPAPSAPQASGRPAAGQMPTKLRRRPAAASGVSPDDRRSDWAYIPWTRVKSKGGSRWLAS